MTTTPVTSAPPGTRYVCRFCRLPSDASGLACPNCGAPVDVRAAVSDSGWVEQPAVRDMARIQFGQSYCQIEGTLVPTADFALAGNDGVIFSHHTLLWAQPGTHLEAWSKGSFFNRTYAGMPLVLMRASGPGHVALSEDHPGEVVVLPIPVGRGFLVREHAFLAASDDVDYTWQNAPVWLQTRSGDDTEYEYPVGPYIDLFVASGRPGLLLLHCPGNLFVRDLAPGQAILVQPGFVGVLGHVCQLRACTPSTPPPRGTGGGLRLPDSLVAPPGPGQGGGALHFRKARTVLRRGPQQWYEPAALVRRRAPAVL